MKKQYAEPSTYESKLAKVMSRLGVQSYDYDWSRFECWVSFTYKGQSYKFTHSVENAKNHGIDIQYGSDVFAQVVLSLEVIARMVERGIYDLSTWVAGIRYLPAARNIPDCFKILQFDAIPQTIDEADSVHKRYPPREWRKNKDEEMDNCLDDRCVANVLCSNTGSGKCTE